MKWKVLSVLFLILLIAATYMLSKENLFAKTDNNQAEAMSIVNIQIMSSGFSPQDISVKKNTVAVFTNSDSSEHELDITSKNDPNFLVSSVLQPGETSTFIFSESGEWNAYTNGRAAKSSVFVA